MEALPHQPTIEDFVAGPYEYLQSFRPEWLRDRPWRIGVIGTAGRDKSRADQMTKALYVAMYHQLIDMLEHVPVPQRFLVSGGAAWADHLAVSAYLDEQAQDLELHIPTHWCTEPDTNVMNRYQTPCFFDYGRVDFKSNPGGTLNYYHQQFSAVFGKRTLDGIQKAIKQGARVVDHYEFTSRGSKFHARNIGLGMGLDLLIAFTWADGDYPADGGTEHCWRNSDALIKLHVSLESLL